MAMTEHFEVRLHPYFVAIFKPFVVAHKKKPGSARARIYRMTERLLTVFLPDPANAMAKCNYLRDELAGVFRVKAGRYRVLYICSTKQMKLRVLYMGFRKEGDRHDAYVDFKKRLKRGDFDADFEELGVTKPKV